MTGWRSPVLLGFCYSLSRSHYVSSRAAQHAFLEDLRTRRPHIPPSGSGTGLPVGGWEAAAVVAGVDEVRHTHLLKRPLPLPPLTPTPIYTPPRQLHSPRLALIGCSRLRPSEPALALKYGSHSSEFPDGLWITLLLVSLSRKCSMTATWSGRGGRRAQAESHWACSEPRSHICGFF